MDHMKYVVPRPQRLDFLRTALKSEFSMTDFDPEERGITVDMTAAAGHRYAPPKRYPTKDMHPRVYFSHADIDGIWKAMEHPENRVARDLLWERANADGDGKLGPRRKNFGKKGDHNYDYAILMDIQAKAFAYALTHYACFGYEAIYMIENYIKTLDIYWMYSDQCREFGFVMFIAACVYDWCHDLLSEEDKIRIIAGIEHRICRGEVEGKANISPSSWGYKMEIGFPPLRQGALVGHGSETQLQRDYLAFSIAIYDEYPLWYEFVAGRFYAEYVAPRSFYYTAGVFPQGTGGYNSGRFTSDLYAALLLRTATGENPYKEEDMRNVLYGLVAPITDIDTGSIFPIGDFRQGARMRLGIAANISAYLFDDPTARAIAKGKEGFTKFGNDFGSLTPVTHLIYSSHGIESAENAFENFPLVHYSGGWCGQTVARKSFDSHSPVCLMKVQCRNTANHDHNAAGTFQIYYKGMLTGDMGNYTGVSYGMTHCVHFMRSTVAHNGLLIYNPALREYEWKYSDTGKPINAQAYYYCGAQKRDYKEPESYEKLLSDTYKTGEVLGHDAGYTADGEPTFAYISGDITPAYHAESVDYVRRSMLTVFHTDKKAPMTLFVCDRIEVKDESFKKTFLLQVPTEFPPVIDKENKQITVHNGQGKLVVTSILGCDQIEGIGGSDESIEDEAYRRRNYTVNGEQLHFYETNPGVTPSDGNSWGRIEFSTSGERTSVMTHVLDVTDINEETASPIRIFGLSDDGTPILEGALIRSTAVLFAIGKHPNTERFSVTLDTNADVYVCGLSAGEWKALEDDKVIANVTVRSNSGIAVFHVKANTATVFLK